MFRRDVMKLDELIGELSGRILHPNHYLLLLAHRNKDFIRRLMPEKKNPWYIYKGRVKLHLISLAPHPLSHLIMAPHKNVPHSTLSPPKKKELASVPSD